MCLGITNTKLALVQVTEQFLHLGYVEFVVFGAASQIIFTAKHWVNFVGFGDFLAVHEKGPVTFSEQPDDKGSNATNTFAFVQVDVEFDKDSLPIFCEWHEFITFASI